MRFPETPDPPIPLPTAPPTTPPTTPVVPLLSLEDGVASLCVSEVSLEPPGAAVPVLPVAAFIPVAGALSLFDAWVDALGASVSLVEPAVLVSLALTPVDVAPVSLVDVPSEVALTPALAVAPLPVVAPPDAAESPGAADPSFDAAVPPAFD